MQSETEPILFPEAEAASGSLSAEERLDWRQFGWGVLAETVENIQDGEGGGEVGEQTLEEDEPQEVTLKDIHDLLSEHLSWQESHGDSGMTANLHETNDADEEEQGSDDENDLLVRFSSLGRSLKTFQRDLTTADQKIESAKKVSSRLRKRRKKRR